MNAPRHAASQLRRDLTALDHGFDADRLLTTLHLRLAALHGMREVTVRRLERGLLVHLAVMNLDSTGTGRERWMIRWKPALKAFEIAFDGGRLAAGRG